MTTDHAHLRALAKAGIWPETKPERVIDLLDTIERLTKERDKWKKACQEQAIAKETP